MKKHILALAVVGALGATSLTASPASVPSNAAQAEVGHAVGKVVTRQLSKRGWGRFNGFVQAAFEAAGAAAGGTLGMPLGPFGVIGGSAVGAA